MNKLIIKKINLSYTHYGVELYLSSDMIFHLLVLYNILQDFDITALFSNL